MGDPTNNEEIEMSNNSAKVRFLIDQLSESAIDHGKKYSEGEMCYAYSYGFFSSAMRSLVDDLNLSKKQLATLQEFVDYSQRRG